MPTRLLLVTLLLATSASACGPAGAPGGRQTAAQSEWSPLFEADLSNAINPGGVWSVSEGVLTASADSVLWTRRRYDDFVLDLEFRNAEGTNSGVIVYASDLRDWIPNSVEIQIADDFAREWAEAPPSWRAGAVFGHQAALHDAVKEPGAWNSMTITARDYRIQVVLNGRMVNDVDLRRFTSATTNPDGSAIPDWLSRPLAEIPREGHIGLQGRHGEADVWFRNLRIRTPDAAPEL